jgi:hypothetical protein
MQSYYGGKKWKNMGVFYRFLYVHVQSTHLIRKTLKMGLYWRKRQVCLPVNVWNNVNYLPTTPLDAQIALAVWHRHSRL